MADSQEPMEVTEETATMSKEPPDVSEETNAVSEVKPIEQSFAQMEVSSEQDECSAKMEVSTEQAESSAQKAEPPEYPEIAVCKQRVKEWYPNLPEQAYFVPAVYMNRTQHKPEKVAGQEVYVLQPLSQDSDARDDVANNKVLRSIKQLARGQVSGVPKQVMFVISQLEFRNYLNNMTEQTQTRALPRAVDDALHQQKKDEGDFDTLIIHREFGVIACEIKAVGDNFAAINLTEAQQIQNIEKRVSSAVKQLAKSRVVLTHLVSDYPKPPRIRVTLMVPNISVEQLGKVLSKYKQLRERLCGSLGIDKTEDPIPKCFTSDDVNNLGKWWKQCMELDRPDPAMTDDLYLDLVARFGGPATTVTVPCSTVPCLAKAHCPVIRTLGEGVVETANRFAPADIILHPTQLDVIHNEASERLVYLCGPPGTGKSLILILRALDWIQEKRKPVHVVITRDGNMAASHMLNQKLKEMTKQTDSGQQQGIAEPAENPWVRLHRFELPIHMKPAVEELAKLESAGELFVIVDEACDVFSSGNNEKTFHDFCTRLHERVGEGLHLWAAAMYHKLKPPNFKEVVLKTALRTPPSITHHVMQHRAIGIGKDVHGYEASCAPLPAYGPDPQVVLHEGPEHQDVEEPHDCEECGRKVAEVLDNLHVGKTGQLSKNSPQPPRYRDVILLTWDSCFHDKTTGKKARPASGLIRGLRQKGFPVTVLETGDANAVGAVGTFSGSDEIVAAGSRFVQGLERKIVVYVETAQPVYYDLDWGRLCSMSLCTSQLIHVKPPDRPPRSGLQQPAAVDPKTSGDFQ
ncbi:uncharacterized protein [Littorina saxatilis]|uniref:Uncharacterized protein n=1 Tax=Littorina saxatilis TaxID=31220 RepID=A0AAN9AZR3_9CAEN